MVLRLSVHGQVSPGENIGSVYLFDFANVRRPESVSISTCYATQEEYQVLNVI